MSIERAFYCNSVPGLFCKGQFDYKYDLSWVQDISLWCASDRETWFNDSHHGLSSFIRGSCPWSNGLLRLTLIFNLVRSFPCWQETARALFIQIREFKLCHSTGTVHTFAWALNDGLSVRWRGVIGHSIGHRLWGGFYQRGYFTVTVCYPAFIRTIWWEFWSGIGADGDGFIRRWVALRNLGLLWCLNMKSETVQLLEHGMSYSMNHSAFAALGKGQMVQSGEHEHTDKWVNLQPLRT